MSKNKLAKFADMERYPHVFQAADVATNDTPFAMRGRWHADFFKNDNPIVLELGCGRGESIPWALDVCFLIRTL